MENLGKQMHDYLNVSIPADKRSSIDIILSLLNTSMGTFLIGGKFAPFPTLSRPDREYVLLSMKGSWLNDIRVLFKAFYSITSLFVYGTTKSGGAHPAWNSLQYPGPIPESKRAEAHEVWAPKFITLDDKTTPVQYNCDVVVVGSGAGGGVMAAELSKAGHKVILVEKASYIHNSDLPLTEKESMTTMTERNAGLYSEDGSIFLLAGKAWGGGTAINWSASLEPPQSLLEEWAKDYGLPHFASPEFKKAINAVSDRIGVCADKIKHNVPNQILLDGCKKLGYESKAIPQNTAHQEHECGWCSYGCPYGVKQSSSITWIRDASDHGCLFMDGFDVERILHENQVAKGVIGKKNGRIVKIKAKRVVLSAGSMNTPAIMLRSNIKNLNPHVGKHLRIHPVSMVSGVFPDKEVKPFYGSIMTAISNEVSNLDGNGYGVRIEVPISHPSTFALTNLWESAESHKRRMMMFPNTASFIMLSRDKDSEGKIWVDSTGMMRFDWVYGKEDQSHMLKALEVGLRILIAEGAAEVNTYQYGIPKFQRNPEDSFEKVLESPEFKSYVKLINDFGAKQGTLGMFAAHQMGTCRMSSDPKQGAVNPRGESYDLKGLYISDTSVFPTASGVNPMVTVYSVAYSIAQFMKEDMANSLDTKQAAKL
ncbi:hypothetical protein BC833DRAFT_594816 [Globomyces pollinis-pini]|nr:hypothetical protein BC833DRAFT_594816 [Globomyces pollinis-pini]